MSTILLYVAVFIVLQFLLMALLIFYKLHTNIRMPSTLRFNTFNGNAQHLFEALDQPHKLHQHLIHNGFTIDQIYLIESTDASNYLLSYWQPSHQINCAVILLANYQLSSYELFKKYDAQNYCNLFVSDMPAKALYAHRQFHQMSFKCAKNFSFAYQHFHKKVNLCTKKGLDLNAAPPSVQDLQLQYQCDLDARIQSKRIKPIPSTSLYRLTIKGMLHYGLVYFPFLKGMVFNYHQRQAKKFYNIWY